MLAEITSGGEQAGPDNGTLGAECNGIYYSHDEDEGYRLIARAQAYL
jgi:hypothetical protein